VSIRVERLGNLTNLSSTDAILIGADVTEGSWRIVRVGNDLDMQRYESGNWVSKGLTTV
jgi:hypothetical protein